MPVMSFWVMDSSPSIRCFCGASSSSQCKSRERIMKLLDLSSDLLLCIADQLTLAREISAFSRSNRYTYERLAPYLLCRYRDYIFSYAIYYQHLELLQKIIHLPLEVNRLIRWQYWREETPLAFVTRNGQTAMVKTLLEASNIDIHVAGGDGMTPIRWAARYDHMEILRHFLNLAETRAEHALDALFEASRYRGVKTVQLLLDYDLDLNATKEGATPLSVAGCHQIEDLLLQDDRVDLDWISPVNGEPIIYTMIKLAIDDERLTHLVQWSKRASFAYADRNGNTVLHLTAARGNLEGCQPFAQRFPWMLAWTNDRGNTPLFCAIQNGQSLRHSLLQVCKYLTDHIEVDWEATNHDGRTVFLECAHSGDLNTFKFLLEQAGKDLLYLKTPEGGSLLMEAARSGNNEIVKFLIDHGADPNVGDHERCTPLMLAIRHSQVTTVKLLLGATGIKIFQRDHQGWTAPIWTVAPGPYAKPDPEIMDAVGRTRCTLSMFYCWLLNGGIWRGRLQLWTDWDSERVKLR